MAERQSAGFDPKCPFCVPSPDRIARENERVLVLWDGFPVSPGHALVVPKRHVASWADASAEEKHALTAGLDHARELIEKEHSPDGYNVGLNDGPVAGQTVMHLHLHVIPRYAGDTADPRGGVRWVLADKAAYWSD